DGMECIVIPWPPRVRQAPGYGEAARILFGKPQYLARHLDGHWKAGIEVHGMELGERCACARERLGRRTLESGTLGKGRPLRGKPDVLGRAGCGPRIHEELLRDAELACVRRREDERAGSLVGFDYGI